MKSFLETVAHAVEVSEIAGSPTGQIQYVVQANKQIAYLAQAAAWGTEVDLQLVKRDLLRHTEVLRAE